MIGPDRLQLMVYGQALLGDVNPAAPDYRLTYFYGLVRRGATAESDRCAVAVNYRVEKAASKAAVGGVRAFIERMKSSASGAPSSRSMPASSHSMEMGPV